MPNYGKKFTQLKKKMEAEKRRHKKGTSSFGSCKCDEMAAEAVQQAQKAAMEGKFGKANAFGGLWEKIFGSGKVSGAEMADPDSYSDESIFDLDRFKSNAVEDSMQFGYSPPLWEMQGPFYNKGYN